MPQVHGQKRAATYDDLLQVPDHQVAELLDGELDVSPRPAPRHAFAAWRLSVALGGPFDEGRGGPGGWLFLPEPELHVGADVLVPDLAGWRRERLPSVPDEAFLTVAPDWICEVLSPATERIDRLKKLRIYARERVTHVWLLNPGTRTLEILRLESDRWLVVGTHGDDEVVTPEPFEAVPLELVRLWSPPPPR